MSKNKKSANKKDIDLCHRIWEGSVGICIQPQKKHSGSYFWKYALTRCYKNRQTGEWNYDQYFSRNNDEALAVVLSMGMQFMDEIDPGRYVEDIYNQYIEGSVEEELKQAA